MGSFVHLVIDNEHAVIEWITKHSLIAKRGHMMTIDASKSFRIHHVTKLNERDFSSSIRFKRLCDQRSPDGIKHNGSEFWLVEITDGCFPRIDAIGNFLPLAATDINRQAVGIIFGLAKREVEHQLALSGRFKPKGAEFKVADFSFIDKVDNPPAIKGVARQTVWMPGDDAIRFTSFNAFKHFIELWTTLYHGTLTLLKAANNFKVFSTHEFTDFGQLITDGAHLPLFGAGRFTDVNKILVVGMHTMPSL